MHDAKLVWITPDADNLVAYMARVSNPSNQDNKETAPKLVNYLIKHKHWSPFEMVNACVEIDTTRDIGRQLLRHRSFTFQEFSGRYAEYTDIVFDRECRMQDHNNRQNSLESVPTNVKEWWDEMVHQAASLGYDIYADALDQGIAKEVARAILPEGLVPTKMYMNGTIRSWVHYCTERTAPGVQKEHRLVAESIKEAVFGQLPIIREAVFGTHSSN